MKSAVVFLIFNRPEQTRRSFNKIREARPPILLVVCDGPRANHPKDVENVNEVRQIIDDGVDWPCNVLKNYSESNLGCRERPASGINWAFSIVDEAIFIEDDCLADETFFDFCDEMLDRFRFDERVMHVNGTNFIGEHFQPRESYFFSKYVWVWGWATWRRAWCHYDYTMASWDEKVSTLLESFDSRREQAFWISTFEEARRDWVSAQAWDFPWIYTCWIRGGLSVVPTVNLIENIGFGPDATHTNSGCSHLHVAARKLDLSVHPRWIRRNQWCDDMMFRKYAGEALSTVSNLIGVLRVSFQQIAKSWR